LRSIITNNKDDKDTDKTDNDKDIHKDKDNGKQDDNHNDKK
jgi:hypothetical protein